MEVAGMETQTSFERIVRKGNLNTSYTPDDFVNPDSYDSHDNRQRAYVILNGGYVLAIVFAEYTGYCEQDAMDEAADSGKLDGLQVTEEDLEDYQVGIDSDGNPQYEGIINLGNASEPFAGESMDVWIINASQFAEDPALMSHERVMTYLVDIRDKADAEYKLVPVTSEDWLPAYKKVNDLDDAITLARLVGNR